MDKNTYSICMNVFDVWGLTRHYLYISGVLLVVIAISPGLIKAHLHGALIVCVIN